MSALPPDDDTGAGRVALALGSGGARGYAHVGVIEELEARGYQIVAVAGSSMGALVGGLHAAGGLPAYVEWARTLTQRDVLRYLDLGVGGGGAMRAEKVIAKVFDLVPDVRIEQLPIPFTAVATDLVAGREVWLQEGLLSDAIRASIAIPGVITPVTIDGRTLADGGILNPVPVSAAAAARADLVVGVSLLGDRRGAPASPVRGAAARLGLAGWRERIRPPIGPRPGAAPAADPAPAPSPVPGPALGLADVMTLTLDAMQAQLARFRLAGYFPDVLVTVPKDACRTGDFHRAAEMIELGRRLAAAALDGADTGTGAPPPE